MSRLRLIPLDDTVVFPGMTLTLPIDTGDDREVFWCPATAPTTPRWARWLV
jgi:hypothetical protein